MSFAACLPLAADNSQVRARLRPMSETGGGRLQSSGPREASEALAIAPGLRGRDLQPWGYRCRRSVLIRAFSPAAIVTLSNRIRPAFRRWGARSNGEGSN